MNIKKIVEFEPDFNDRNGDSDEGEDDGNGAPCYQVFQVGEPSKKNKNIRKTVNCL